ncbi:MAG: MucR family transcriptional regulator, partial [Alphaproteobacteria bacterium]
MVKSNAPDILELTTKILSAHLRNNNLPMAELPDFMQTVHSALAGISGQGAVDSG